MKSLFPHSATTRDVTVRVAVSFLPEQSAPDQGRWFWSYHIRIENGGERGQPFDRRCWKRLGQQGSPAADELDGKLSELLFGPGAIFGLHEIAR